MTKELKFSLLLLLLLSLFKFWQLNGGVILAEPDERIYLEAAKSLSRSPFPYLSGIPFFYGLPLHTYLVFLLSKVFPDGYVAGRLLSVLASLGLTAAIYYHVRWKFGQKAAFWSALFFIFCPLSIFYSRVGIIEMTVAAFSIGSLFAFDYGLTTNNRKHLFLGGFL
ncbi:MAG: glycosyltransferase family 39 protein, partial [bacterium]|nr:glycosyltransferase family 39 protein [bacterium]